MTWDQIAFGAPVGAGERNEDYEEEIEYPDRAVAGGFACRIALRSCAWNRSTNCRAGSAGYGIRSSAGRAPTSGRSGDGHVGTRSCIWRAAAGPSRRLSGGELAAAKSSKADRHSRGAPGRCGRNYGLQTGRRCNRAGQAAPGESDLHSSWIARGRRRRPRNCSGAHSRNSKPAAAMKDLSQCRRSCSPII